MYLDLDGKSAHAQLAKLSGRAWEIWPPLDQTPDADGRRLEAVVALVDDQPNETARAAISATAAAGRVEPPLVDGPAPGWLSYKLFGAPDRADAVLLGVVSGLVDDARRAGELRQWFYLRYVDAPGRPHLRLRLLPAEGKATALDAHLSERLAPARACSDVVAVERGEYFREWARYGRDAMPLIERAFEVDSDLALALAAVGEDDADAVTSDVTERIVLALDTLASSLDLTSRRALAGRRRRAHEHELTEDLAPEYRARQRRLVDLLAHPPPLALEARAPSCRHSTSSSCRRSCTCASCATIRRPKRAPTISGSAPSTASATGLSAALEGLGVGVEAGLNRRQRQRPLQPAAELLTRSINAATGVELLQRLHASGLDRADRRQRPEKNIFERRSPARRRIEPRNSLARRGAAACGPLHVQPQFSVEPRHLACVDPHDERVPLAVARHLHHHAPNPLDGRGDLDRRLSGAHQPTVAVSTE